jgi:hypothetical protein
MCGLRWSLDVRVDDCSRLPYPYTLPSSLFPLPRSSASRFQRDPSLAFQNKTTSKMPKNPAQHWSIPSSSVRDWRRRRWELDADTQTRRREETHVHHLVVPSSPSRHPSPSEWTNSSEYCLASRLAPGAFPFGLFTFQLKRPGSGRGTHGIETGTDRREGNRIESTRLCSCTYLTTYVTKAESKCRLCMKSPARTLKSRRQLRQPPCPKNRVNSGES